MHRQSLGSPASKLHCHGDGVLFSGTGIINSNTDSNLISDNHRKDKPTPCQVVAGAADDEERKSQKSNQQKSLPVSSTPRLIHLIPLLTFFCFLILYLSSHDPSKNDLAQISGFTTLPSNKIAIDSIDGDRSMEIKKYNVLVIRSMMNLQQEQRRRLHRKFRH